MWRCEDVVIVWMIDGTDKMFEYPSIGKMLTQAREADGMVLSYLEYYKNRKKVIAHSW